MKTVSLRLTAAIAAFAACCATAASGPLRSDHPIVGTWRFVLPDGSCHEIYRIRADGTALITSAKEVAESEFAIDDQPDEEGYYQSDDRIVKDNGKEDCTGEVTRPGHQIKSFILFHPSRNMFLMCQRRDTDSCIGPFVRVRGTDT